MPDHDASAGVDGFLRALDATIQQINARAAPATGFCGRLRRFLFGRSPAELAMLALLGSFRTLVAGLALLERSVGGRSDGCLPAGAVPAVTDRVAAPHDNANGAANCLDETVGFAAPLDDRAGVVASHEAVVGVAPPLGDVPGVMAPLDDESGVHHPLHGLAWLDVRAGARSPLGEGVSVDTMRAGSSAESLVSAEPASGAAGESAVAGPRPGGGRRAACVTRSGPPRHGPLSRPRPADTSSCTTRHAGRRVVWARAPVHHRPKTGADVFCAPCGLPPALACAVINRCGHGRLPPVAP